jgi:hypothetical protein
MKIGKDHLTPNAGQARLSDNPEVGAEMRQHFSGSISTPPSNPAAGVFIRGEAQDETEHDQLA